MSNSNDLSSQMNDILQLYSDEVLADVRTICKEEADNLVNTLKGSSPKNQGKYAKGWTAKQQDNSGFSDGYVVYNKNYYYLTHLLENGHLNRDGSRTEASPHIKPAEEETVNTVQKRIEEAVNK